MALEYQGALGAQVIKICLGKDQNGKATIGLDFVKAQNFIPLSWDNGMIREGVFLDRRVIAGRPYVRVETHRLSRPTPENPEAPSTGYIITNRAYNEETQIEVSLDRFGDGIEPEVYIASDKPLFAYIRNPEANNINPESPTGISLFANAIDTIQALDIAFDQFYSEIELGGRRIALPGAVFRTYSQQLDDGTSKRVSYFDPSDRLFMRLEGDDAEKFKPTDLTFDIRAAQFKDSIQTLLDILAMLTGFDTGYFSFNGVSVKTATEIISENSHTYKTMAGFRDNLDAGLKHIFTVINELGRIYNIQGASDKEVSIVWDDSVIEDRTARANYYSKLYQDGLLDLESALVKIHRINKEDAAAMASKIKSQRQTVGAESLFGAGV
jgi:A118 family predicted phage portal protein